MNSIFSLKRTWHLIRKRADESKWNFLITSIIQVLISLFWLGLFSFLPDNQYFKLRDIALIMSLALGVSIYHWSNYKIIIQKSRIIDDIKLPNSTFESWLVSISHIFLVIVFHVFVFDVIDYLVLTNHYDVPSLIGARSAILYNFRDTIPFGSVAFFLIIGVSFYMHKTVKKKHLFTMISMSAIFGVFLLNEVINHILFSEKLAYKFRWFSVPFQEVYMRKTTFNNRNYTISSGVSDENFLLFFIFPIVIIWLLIYYFRLKETEV